MCAVSVYSCLLCSFSVSLSHAFMLPGYPRICFIKGLPLYLLSFGIVVCVLSITGGESLFREYSRSLLHNACGLLRSKHRFSHRLANTIRENEKFVSDTPWALSPTCVGDPCQWVERAYEYFRSSKNRIRMARCAVVFEIQLH